VEEKTKQELEISKHFPATVEVTQEMIDKADIYHKEKCIGAIVLKSILKDVVGEVQVRWGSYYGSVEFNNRGYLQFESFNESGKIRGMMNIKHPTTVVIKINY